MDAAGSKQGESSTSSSSPTSESESACAFPPVRCSLRNDFANSSRGLCDKSEGDMGNLRWKMGARTNPKVWGMVSALRRVASIFGLNYSYITYTVGTCRAWKLFGQLRVSPCNLLEPVIGSGGGNDDELHDSRQDDKPDSSSDGVWQGNGGIGHSRTSSW